MKNDSKKDREFVEAAADRAGDERRGGVGSTMSESEPRTPVSAHRPSADPSGAVPDLPFVFCLLWICRVSCCIKVGYEKLALFGHFVARAAPLLRSFTAPIVRCCPVAVLRGLPAPRSRAPRIPVERSIWFC